MTDEADGSVVLAEVRVALLRKCYNQRLRSLACSRQFFEVRNAVTAQLPVCDLFYSSSSSFDIIHLADKYTYNRFCFCASNLIYETRKL